MDELQFWKEVSFGLLLLNICSIVIIFIYRNTLNKIQKEIETFLKEEKGFKWKRKETFKQFGGKSWVKL